MSADAQAADRSVAELCRERQYTSAVTVALEAHGGEIMRFLVSRARDPQLASDAFSTFSEDLCRGLPSFAFACTLRTWVFTLAHHALARTLRTRAREGARVALRSEGSIDARPAAGTRSSTPAYLRSEVKLRMRDLREQLPEDDQLLIELRTTRRFSWKDIARIRLGEGATVAPAELDREAARLRKRFQLATERLRNLAIEQGIIPGPDN
jgi:RNA polymerase sigma-70 factor (ECF subfamily)